MVFLKLNDKVWFSGLIDSFGTIINTILSFIMLKLYLNQISYLEYGIWLSIYGLASMIGMIEVGIDQYYMSVIPIDRHFFDKKFSEDLTFYLIFKVFIALLFVLISTGVYFFIFEILKIPLNYHKLVGLLFSVSTFYFIVNLFVSSLITILNGRGYFSYVNLFTNIVLIINSLITFLLLKLDLGLVAFPVALLISSIISLIIYLFKIRKLFVHLSFGKLSFRNKREVLGFSFSFQILKWAFLIRSQSLVIVINNVVGPVGVTIFTVTNRIAQMIPTFFSKFLAPLFPRYSNYIKSGQISELQDLVIYSTKLLLRYSIFLFFFILLFNKGFIVLWVGPDNFGGVNLNLQLGFYAFLISVFSGFGMIIYSSRKFEKWPVISIVEVISSLLFSFLLGNKFGLQGVFFGFLIVTFFSQCYVGFIALRQISLSKYRLISNSVIYAIKSNSISIPVGLLIYFTVSFNSWFSLISSFLVYVLSHLVPIELNRFIKFNGKGIINRIYFAFDL